jgi:hypothetical protein
MGFEIIAQIGIKVGSFGPFLWNLETLAFPAKTRNVNRIIFDTKSSDRRFSWG